MDGSLNPAAIFKDRFTNINTAKGQIEKQREREQHQERLRLEFNQIDVNGDGKVTFEELYTFLQEKVRVSTVCFSIRDSFPPHLTFILLQLEILTLNRKGAPEVLMGSPSSLMPTSARRYST